ncbi:MAG: 30S ribosomal protein S17 [bacterium]|nr:30S ribosomal protein S17 [bacterium]
MNQNTPQLAAQKMVEGYVASNKMDKTVVVTVTTQKKHSSYGKYIKSTKRYMAHDAANDCNIGDKVQIVECRPLSKNKRWRVSNIIERAI